MAITAGRPEITIGGKKIERGIERIEVQADLDKPDMAELRLDAAVDDENTSFKPGDEVLVKMGLEMDGSEQDTIFKGKVTGVSPVFDTHSPPAVTIRAMNDLHKLARERKTRTYTDQTEKQIIEKIAGEHGLTADFGSKPPTMQHKHVHQNNQTDLEFIRVRAARIGREVFVQDKKLYYREREKDKGPVAKLEFRSENRGGGAGGGEWGALENFQPHMSAANQAKKVTVRGWNPDKKEPIVGSASAANSRLGQQGGSTVFGDAPEIEVHNVPVKTKEEADAVAQSILDERLMSYITGTGVTRGNAKIKPGKVVEIKCFDKRFNGKYYVTAVKHTYTDTDVPVLGGQGMAGFKTQFSFKRDAEQG